MSLLNSAVLLIAFIFLLFIFWPGALLVAAVWVYLQIRKRRRTAGAREEDGGRALETR